MLRYLKSAFLARVPVPALGAVPVNVLGVAAFGVLGFAEPVFWMVGTALETIFLFGLATNARFQKLVDARHQAVSDEDTERKRMELIRALPYDLQMRLARLAARIDEAARVLSEQHSDDLTLEASYDALRRLQWVYLKLLVARDNLVTSMSSETEASLSGQVAALEAELKAPDDSEALRRSKAATLAILTERLANVHRRAESLKEIDSDATRIEAQVELMIENATLQGKPQTISTDIELATDLASTALFGDSEPVVADIDQAYRPRNAGPAAERN